MPIKIIFLLKRKRGLTPDQFRQHYETSHVKLAQTYVGHLLLGYRRNYPTFASLNPSAQSPDVAAVTAPIDYDAIAEMWVSDEAALAELSRIFNDPAVSPILAADEVQFLRREDTLMLVCEEVDTGVLPPFASAASR